MKWFFALAEDSPGFAAYADMVRVAVHTAMERTSLEPAFLYDGKENELTAWLRRRGVVVVPCVSRYRPMLREAAGRRGDPWIETIGAGAFLRCEAARVAAAFGWDDEWALYTDCDVMFVADVAKRLAAIRPRRFAVTPEDLAQPRAINTGVMVMNLRYLRGVDAAFERFTRDNLEEFLGIGWDQDAFRECFQFGPRAKGNSLIARAIRRLRVPLWESLPPEFNWRPYWGDASRAAIIHFHGPKPHQRQIVDLRDDPVWIAHVKPLATSDFYRLADEWDAALRRAG